MQAQFVHIPSVIERHNKRLTQLTADDVGNAYTVGAQKKKPHVQRKGKALPHTPNVSKHKRNIRLIRS